MDVVGFFIIFDLLQNYFVFFFFDCIISERNLMLGFNNETKFKPT